jgi:hypothetical protein
MRAKATDDQILAALQEANGIRAKVAIKFGLNERSLLMRLKKMKEKGYTIPDSTYQPGHQIVDKGDYEFTPLPDDDVPIEELIAQRKRKFQHKREHEEASKLIPIRVKMAGAIGLLHFGDPHVDDDGTDLEAIERHTELVRNTEGLFGCSVGDASNNWVGRLARLYAEQSTSASQAWRLVEWFVNRCDWLYMIAGNHDCHDAQTEALTRRGWVKYDDIQDSDEVLSFDADTGTSKWAPILKKIVRHHSGEMIGINTLSVSLNVTPNHRILCRDRDWKRNWREWKFVSADSLPARVALPVSGKSTNVGVDLSDEQIALAGWILTDGSIGWSGNSPRISVYQSKDGAEIDRIINALGLEHRVTVRNRQISVVNGRTLVSEPMPQKEWRLTADASRQVLSYLPEKGKLPEWADRLSERQFGVLLDAIVAGDGTWDGANPEDKSVAVVHGEKGFLDSLQAVAVRHGWYARISVAREKDYRLNLCKRDTIQFETKPATTKSQYDGVVWCLTVPLGNFMIRRNGAAHFSGNCWSGAGDPLRWIAKQQNSLYKASEARIGLQFPNGLEVRVNARHDHSGSSIWNPAHGPMKAALMGTRDHLYVAGHKHESAYSVLKDPISGITMHAMKVASYKIYDRYAKERGFRDNSLSPCALTTINPALPPDHPDLVKVWWEPEEGADYLTFLRRR